MVLGRAQAGAAAVVAAAAVLALPASAPAATTLGETFATGSGQSCTDADTTYVQTDSNSPSYTAPSDGVVTSWSVDVTPGGPVITFKVVRAAGGNKGQVVGSSGPQTLNDGLNTYPTRIPVRQGDTIGYHRAGPAFVCARPSAGATLKTFTGNRQPGQTASYATTIADTQLDLSAVIESDRDADGFGDETQDSCPTNAATAGPCPLPTVLGITDSGPGGDAGSFCEGQTATSKSLPGYPFAAPADGVITAWTFEAGGVFTDPTVKLKVLRSVGADSFQAIGEDGPRIPQAAVDNTYPVRIPVRAGDRVGIWGENVRCRSSVASNTETFFFDGDLGLNQTAAFTCCSTRFPIVNAMLEPDADRDGYGDTTQDGCDNDASTAQACATGGDSPPPTVGGSPPDTTLTKVPKKKVTSKRAKFEFSSNEMGAGFECKLDDAKFAACQSPHKVKVSQGKHSFEVRAIDSDGHADPTPAKASWKVKRKQQQG